MEVSITPQNLRTFLPINITITSSAQTPSITVTPPQGSSLQKFSIDPSLDNQQYHAEFWIRQPGQYKVMIEDGAESIIKPLTVKEQHFLAFNEEFGTFTVLFLLLSLGVFLWHRKRTRLI